MRYLPRRAFYVSGGGKLKRNYPWWFCLLPLPLVWWAAVAVASHWQTGGLNSVLAALNAALAAPFAYGHWVCVVGINPTADPDNLKESDFYALDPARVSANGTLALTRLLDGTIWTANSPLKIVG